jgi:DNA-binding response OmpR family regulator
VFRRLDRASSAPGDLGFRIGEVLVDVAGHTIHRGTERIPLTAYEVALLKLLYDRVGQAVSRDEILDQVWGIEANPTNRTVDNFVVKLRKKIEPGSDKPRHILTVYGVGYKLVL